MSEPVKDQDTTSTPKTERKSHLDVNAARSRAASVIWLVARILALILAIGALCVVLDLNRENDIIEAFLDLAAAIDFGSFRTFDGANAEKWEALVNFGIAALIWLGLGKVLERVIRP